jgi:hypothetical protein
LQETIDSITVGRTLSLSDLYLIREDTMQIRFLLVKKQKDWMITWKENKLRWFLFYYLLGLIIALLITFLEETLSPVPARYLYKGLMVTVVIPILVIISWTYRALREEQ